MQHVQYACYQTSHTDVRGWCATRQSTIAEVTIVELANGVPPESRSCLLADALPLAEAEKLEAQQSCLHILNLQQQYALLTGCENNIHN